MHRALSFCLVLTLGVLLTLPDGRAQIVSDEAAPAAAPAGIADSVAPVSAPRDKDTQEETPTHAEEQAIDAPAQAEPSVPYSGSQDQSERPSAPDVYLLPDGNGKLRKVLGFRYEDFFDAWRRGNGAIVETPPRYVIEAWNVAGEATASQVKVTTRFEVATQTSGWIEVPIQLPELILQDVQIEGQQPGECLVYDQQRHGYVLWLQGQPATQRVIELKGIIKLRVSGGVQRLQLHLPRAVTTSFMAIVSEPSARFESSPELALETSDRPNGMTEVRLTGQANPLQLSWTIDDDAATDDAAPLAVEETTVAHVGRRSVSYETTLRIDSFGRPLERVRVLLPRRAKLKAGIPQSAYQIRELSSPDDVDQRQEVEIRSLAAGSEPWNVKLAATHAIESFGEIAECPLDGFEVLDAFQQAGTVTVQVDDQLQAYFDLYGEIEQIPFDRSIATPAHQFALGRFRYARFPWKIVVFASPRQRRVSVQPKYDLMIDSDKARLDIEYAYQLTGAQMFSLRLDLQGWKLTDDPIDSSGAIDLTRVVERNEGRLILPLVDENREQLSVKLSLQRSIQLGENTFSLPEPLDAFVTDGELTVDSVASLQVLPQAAAMVGLSVLAAPADLTADLTDSDNEEIRLRTFLPRPTFAAGISQRQLELIADLHSHVEIDQQVTRVRQRVDYQAKYKPVAQLLLAVPEQLWTNETLRLGLAGEELPFALSNSSKEGGSLVRDEANSGRDESELRELLVSLPRPMQKKIAIDVEYEVDTPPLAVTELTALKLPLVTPVDMLSSQTAEIRASQPVLATLNQRSDADEWQVETREASVGNSSRELLLSIAGRPSSLSLFVQLDSVDSRQLATLERAWIQSWIAYGQWQQRAVFRFRTPHNSVFVQLPAVLDGSAVELLLDGEPSTYEQLSGSRLALLLDQQKVQQSHTLEVRYQVEAPLSDFGALQLEVPQLECRITSAPIYWQLILPQGWQALQAPGNLIPDYWLGWRHYRWGRQPTLSQADLEQITAAVPAMAPAPSSSQYVYRAFDFPAKIQVTVVRQAWLFLGFAVAVFLLGLLCLYTSIAKSGIFWLGLSLTFLLGVFSYPEITLLAIEVVLVGGLMTIVALVLNRIFVAGPKTAAEVSNLHTESSEVTEPWQQQPSIGPAIAETTATLKTGGPSS